MRDARMRRQFGHGLAVGRQRVAVQGAEALQQILRLGIRGGGRYVEPDQFARGHAPASELQSEAGQIRRENFCAAISRQLFVLILRPQAIAHARLQSPGAAGTLGGAGLGNSLRVEAGHAAARIETRHPRQPGIDDHAHAVDGQAGLGDVGCQHHFALTGRRRIDRCTLRIEVEFAVQRAQQNVFALTDNVGQLLMHAADFRLSRQEHQQAAGLVVQRFEYGLGNALVDVFTRLERPAPAHRHRVHAPFTAQDRRVIEQAGQALAFEGRRHQQNLQRLFSAKQLATVQTERQRQIGVETAFMKFVEDQQTHAFQRRVVLQAPGEDAFGDHFDTRLRANLAVEADAIADGFTDLLAELAGQTLRRRPRSQAPWFEHDDGLPDQPGLVEQGQGHAGGFTGAGRCFEHGFVA